MKPPVTTPGLGKLLTRLREKLKTASAPPAGRLAAARAPGLALGPLSRHLLFRLSDGGASGARSFLRLLTPDVTMADADLSATTDSLVNVGLSYNGLAALGVDPALLSSFDSVYANGPNPFALGDVPGSPSDMSTWWNTQFTTGDLHCIVHVYARTQDQLDATTAKIRGMSSSRSSP